MRCLRLVLIAVGVSVGCTPPFIHGRKSPPDTIRAASQRLVDHGIQLDPTGANPRQARSISYCFRGADRQGFQWRRAFGRPAPAPIGFERTGAQEEHDKILSTCPIIFRVIIQAEPISSGSRIRIESEWWKLHAKGCVTAGNPLLGTLRCDYTYRGTRAPRDIRDYLYGMLKDL